MVKDPTHKVVITLVSKADEPDVNMKVEWDPLMGDDEMMEQGFEPAAYVVARNILFSMEDMVDKARLLELEEGDLDGSRSIN